MFASFCLQRYNVSITDWEQPLVLAAPPKRSAAPGNRPHPVGPIHLVPELCTLAGLPSDLLADQRLMRTLVRQTRLQPRERVRELCAFADGINRYMIT